MEEYTRKSWDSYAKRKSEVPNIAEKHTEYCKGLGLKIEFLRCDNGGEHQAKLIAAWNRHGIAMEYTAPRKTTTKWNCGTVVCNQSR